MQTPLVTNFSRGILSPKFFGRVESELYAAGAADLRNFIVNNQGSIERRPGTYRLWNTKWTYPAQGATDQFLMPYVPGQQYSLTLIEDGGKQGRFILSTQHEHRYFEVEQGEYMHGDDLGLLVLTEYEDGGDFYQEAHKFEFTDHEANIVDDAFRVSIGNVSFMRTRSSAGYQNLKTVVWHADLSRDIARNVTTDPPFVEITPFPPPEYDRDESVISHEVGFVSEDVDGNTRETSNGERFVPQVVGAKYKGQYKHFPQRSRVFGPGGVRNATENEPADADMVTFSLDDEVQGLYGFNQDTTPIYKPFRFYGYYPGRSGLYIKGREISAMHLGMVDPTAEQVQINMGLLEQQGTNTIMIRYRNRKRKKRRFRKNKTTWKKWDVNRDLSAEVNARRAHYQDNTYTLETTMTWDEIFEFELHLMAGNGHLIRKIPTNKYTIVNDGTNVTGVTITDEYNIGLEGKKPRPGDYYLLTRLEADTDQDVITRRVLPWARTESAGVEHFNLALETISSDEEWLAYSRDRIRESKSVAITGGRMILLESEDELKFRVSASRDYANFSDGESEVDAYDFTIETDSRERLRWLTSMREGVVVGTDKNEYVIMNTHSPSSVVARRFTGFGSALPYSIRFGDKILFVTRDRKRIMSYSYSDELAAWYSQDITSVAQHLFERGIRSIHYQPDPISIIWVLPEEDPNVDVDEEVGGGIYALTWEDSTGVMAWTHHMPGVHVLAATVATIDDHTVLVMAVARGSGIVLEALDLTKTSYDDVYYIDSAEYLVFQTEENSTDVFGPDSTELTENLTINFSDDRFARFQNSDIAIMVDGHTEKVMVGTGQPHTNSTLTVGPFPGADIPVEFTEDEQMVTVGIGYVYTSRMQTMPILVQSPSGAGLFKDTQVQKIRVRIDNSGHFKAGNDPDDLDRIEVDGDDGVMETETGYYTGDVKFHIQSRWMKRPYVIIESYYSDPLSVLALMVDVQVYE